MDYISYQQTPLQPIRHPLLTEKRVSLIVKREDLNHPHVSGNKWWKLKYNVLQAAETNSKILTFGGAFSNHIYATAAATNLLKMPSIGVIRGEMTLPLNHTLHFAQTQGMKLHFVSREEYKTAKHRIALSLEEKRGECFVIPEGGSNVHAARGVAEFASTLPGNFDYVVLPVGTGGTMAGLICGFTGSSRLLGISVLKNGGFLNGEIEKLCVELNSRSNNNWTILTEYHHGGYAKVTNDLLRFIETMSHYSLPLDHVYTGKALYAVLEEVRKGNIKPGSSILFIHTGGLQGSFRVKDLEQH